MEISTVIRNLKDYCRGVWNNKVIDEQTTRDQILYGDPRQTCTGIVTTCWATVDVIRQAAMQGANLIIVHEALFWNHGDHQDWLKETQNKTYEIKTRLLDEHRIVVWRFHDYIHSGIPLNETVYADGIFTGVAHKLRWSTFIDPSSMRFLLPKITVKELAHHIISTLHLNGARILGNPDAVVEKICIPYHILGDARREIIAADKGEVDCFLTMEAVDFTLSEYIRDAAMTGQNKAIISIGHFNLEEYGMEYLLTYIHKAIKTEIPCRFIQSGDMYQYVCSYEVIKNVEQSNQ